MTEPKLIETPDVKAMSDIERSEAQMRTWMQGPDKLKEWLAASGRAWLVFNATHLVDSMDSVIWEERIRDFQNLVAGYRDHRAGIKHHQVPHPDPKAAAEGKMMDVGFPETLTIEELDRAIRFLITQASELDPNWKLENNPL